jgi:hypothetical protein
MQPVAMTVTADMIAKDQFAASSSTPLQGELVQVTTGGPFTVSSTMASEFTGTCTSMTGMMGTQYYGFEISGGGKTIAVGTNFYQSLTYCIPACGYPCTNPVTTQNFTSIEGIVEPSSNSTTNDVFLQIAPVSDAQLPHS